MSRTTARVAAAAAASGELPPVCVVTGEPADRRLGITFTWVPGWTWVLLPFGILPFIVARWFAAQRIACVLPLTGAVLGRYRTVRRVVAAGIAVGIGLMVVSVMTDASALAWLGAAALLAAAGGLFWLVVWFVTVQPARDLGYVLIRRAHRNFAVAAGS